MVRDNILEKEESRVTQKIFRRKSGSSHGLISRLIFFLIVTLGERVIQVVILVKDATDFKQSIPEGLDRIS